MTWLNFNPYESKREKKAHIASVKSDMKGTLPMTGLGLLDFLGGAYVLATQAATYTNTENVAIVLASALGALFSVVGAYSAYEDYQIIKAIKKTPVQKASEKTLDDTIEAKELIAA